MTGHPAGDGVDRVVHPYAALEQHVTLTLQAVVIAAAIALPLAAVAHLSVSQFGRVFKEVYGETPHRYLQRRRVERAMTLLRQGELSVTEVCFAVGFSSLGTFSTRFSELVGVPPSVYRQRASDLPAGIPPCVSRRVTRPVRNQEARPGVPVLA